MGKLLFLNGRRFSHSSLEITILKSTGRSELFSDVDSADYGDHLNLAFVRGTNRQPIGITAGEYETDDCNLSMGKSTFQMGIVAAIGNGWLGSNISLTFSYSDIGEPLTVDRVVGVIAGATDGSKAGPDPNKTALRVVAMYISRNGILPLQNMIT